MNRYSRQTVLPEIGDEGQKVLSEGQVAVIGLGGLGSVMAEVLARAGVGGLKVIDRDVLELSNLQRQALYEEEDVGKAKAELVKEKLSHINSEVDVDARVIELGAKNVEKFIGGVDIVLDATDNMKTRFLLNDACVKNEVPWIYTSILGTYGMTMDIIPGKGPCLRCLIDTMPDPGSMETCATAGVLFSLPRILANTAATEAVKYLVKAETRDTLLAIDIWKNDYEQINVSQRNDCLCCVEREFEYLKKEDDFTTSLCGRDAVQVTPDEEIEIDLNKFVSDYGGKKIGRSLVKFEVEEHQLTLFKDGRLIVDGTDDPHKAVSIYSEYIGR
ncbi:MAG: ThiF family adenylyltransferase [Thermoplasmata archaeon]